MEGGAVGGVRRLAILGLAALGAGLGGSVAWAQGPAAIVRVALVPQWVIQQHRTQGAARSPGLRDALEGGVVDRTVFFWQRGVIQRQALVPKPIRVLSEPEAGPLGGHGRFDLTAVRPPIARAAWTEIDVSRARPSADDVLMLEIGGERNTITQVLETLLVLDPSGRLAELPLARPALVSGPGVPVVAAPFEQPLPPVLARRFRDEAGMGLLVVRSPLWDVRNGDLTASGRADTVPFGGGDWREGDRVFLRIPVATLDRGAPALVLGWKDRTLQTDPNFEFPRRSALPLPLVR